LARTHFGAKKTIRKPDLDQVLATIDVPNPDQRNGPRFGNLDQPYPGEEPKNLLSQLGFKKN
jgi:hypothetical protein